ncbi:MAG: hypothetical protein ACRENU_04175 [Gemmatimonadaceae bacterium]
MNWPTGLFRLSSYDRRKAEAMESHSTNGTAPPAGPRADVQRAIAIATEPIADNGQRPSYNRHATAAPTTETAESAPSADTGHVVHDLLEGLEVSFGIEAAQVEREALETARSWAEKGLPRHDLALNGRLDVEDMLAHRTSHVFSDWARRVRDRVEGAIQSESEQVGARLLSLEQRLLRYKYLLDGLRGSRAEVAQAQFEDDKRADEASRAPKRRVAYAARLGSIPFWLFCAILVLADFVANVPVFNELLPSSPVAMQALQNIETNATANPETYGFTTFFARLGMHLDASILAFSVVLFLVVLGHFFGSALRTIVALHRARPIVDDELLHKHRHQPTVVAWFSLAGILTIVTVLFLARAGIEPATRARLAGGEAAVVAKRQQVAEAQQRNDLALVQQLDVERQTLEGQVPVLRARHEYAVSIASINWPIAALNLVLALCAALLAYQHQSETLELDPAHTVRAPAARERYRALRTSVEDERASVCALASDIDTRLRRTRHLAESRPLLRADGKAARLRGVIPLFRAENARTRGMDTRSILAFQAAVPDVIPGVDESAFQLPDVFEDSLKRYGDLQSRFLELEGEREAATETIA